MLPRALSPPPPPRRPFSAAVGGNAEESEDENESIADPEEWLRTQMQEMREFASGPPEFAAQPPRRRQRDVLAVNTFDRKPIEERLEIPYEVAFRLICDVGDQGAATERIEQVLEIMGLSETTVQPLINQSPASFDRPQFSRRGSGFLVGTLRQVAPLFVAMIKRMMAANSRIPVQLEVMNIYEMINPNQPIKYYDGWMDCTSFGFGSMPSNALFLERMAYRAFENGPSNVDLIENSLMSANNVADGRVLASWMDFQFSRRLLHLTFAVPINPRENEGLRYAGYRLTIQFSMIREIVAVFHATDDENRILLRLKSPPNLWRAQPKRIYGKMSLNLIACRDWVRVLHYETADGTGLSSEVLGMSSVLSIGLPRTQAYPSDAESYEVFHREEEGNFLKSGCLFRYFNLLGRLQTALKCPLLFSAVRFLHLGSELSPVVCPDFDSPRLNYAVQGLLERGFVVLDQLITSAAEDPNNPPFFQRIRAAFKENAEACEEAMEDLLSICDERRLTTLLRSFDVLFRQKVGGSSVERSFCRLNELPKNSVLVKKVIVTPLRRLFFPPQVMMCNRIVRKFGEQYALRCIFRDENGQRLSSRNFVRGRFTNLPLRKPSSSRHVQSGLLSAVAEEIMAQTVRRTLLQPIVVGGLKFRFLAWSNSQLRDHGCYMYADHHAHDEAGNVQFVNVDTIRDWMGDFSAVKSIPKLMSRMGQCFTQAFPTIQLRPRDWCVIPDFESDFLDPGNGKNYVFSDGVGRISERFADRIAAMMDIQPTPSCFQVRFKGFKGIVVVWPNLLANPFYPDVVFRESQKKFEDTEDETKATLEVVKYSMPSPVSLNRPLIMILDQVAEHQSPERYARVSHRITEIFERELDGLGAMLTNDRMAAIQLASRTTSPIGFQQVARAGIRITDEPFLRQMLFAIYRYCICQDMIKASDHVLPSNPPSVQLKIPIPPSAGRTMYGVIDELGYLNPGQVFVQCSPNIHVASNVCRPFVGQVMISKNPCHVPGDVRLFDAVFVPELSHLRDVVVFPRFGARPHTDEMSGSDLDGDEYTVIFEDDLFIEHNEPPMSFPKKTAAVQAGANSTSGIVDFFLKYLDQDTIGRVSNAHLIAADKCGIYHPVCESIAAKCSIAVDFPKTGEPADPLTDSERFNETPDFMAVGQRFSYKSKRLLGKLFRKARVLEQMLEVVSSESEVETKADVFLLDEELEAAEASMFAQAITVRDLYYAKLQQILDEYAIESEAEALSGHASFIRRISDMEKSDYSFYHADRLVEMRMTKIREKFREEFFDECGGEAAVFQPASGGQLTFVGPDRLLAKARCWYTVAYGRAAEDKLTRFRSFPWLVWDVLLVARRKQIVKALSLGQTLPPVTSALYPHLDEYVRNFTSLYNDEVTAFVFHLRPLGAACELFDRYVHVYGTGLVHVCFMLNLWLQENEMYEKGAFDCRHLIVLVLQFGMGIRKCADQFVTGDVFLPVRVESMDAARQLKAAEKPPPELRETSRFLLEFVRFFGSSQISLARRLDLRFDNQEAAEELVLEDPKDWTPISDLAYRTFHYSSLSRNFEAFVNKFSVLVA
ncbi:RNA-directed RNA polymerase [Aphelenchoides fujianensis]|nr:RNA-directed RNA polymerase [Aphelenchoides fujianensis]